MDKNKMSNQLSDKQNNPWLPKAVLIAAILMIVGGGYLIFSEDATEPVAPPRRLKSVGGESEIAAIETEMSRQASADQMVEMVEVLEKHLKDLADNRVEEAYNTTTSKEFKAATSLSDYIDFLKQYPEIQSHSAVSFIDKEFMNEKGIIRANLIYKDQPYPVDFILTKEDGLWKIRSLKSRPVDASSNVEEKEKEKLVTLVDRQIDLLKKGMVERAYQENHNDFKETTTLENYQEFLSNFPEISRHQQLEYGLAKEQGPLATMPVIFKTEEGESSFSFWFRQENNEWKLLGMNVIQSSTYPPASEAEKTALTEAIKEQLKALKDGDYSQAYYGYVASDFEKTTSLQSFKEFVSSYPIFREFQKMNVDEAVKEGELRLVKVTLIAPKEQAEVDYRFALEGKKWKIWGMQILTNPVEAPAHQDEKALIQIINEQMSAVHQGDLSKAYYAYTSSDFQETTTREVFTSFMQGQSVFKNNTNVSSPKTTFKDNLATVTVEIESENGDKKSVEYKFVYEQTKWKIMAIQIVEDLTPKEVNQKNKENRMSFAKILIGTETDALGIVIKNNTIFTPADKEITVNLQVSQGVPGATIEMVLEHLESGSSIPAIQTKLKSDGDSMVTFVFIPPPQGWPIGTYKLHATSSTGLVANYSFVVKSDKPETPASTPSPTPDNKKQQYKGR